jgi:hypothetical protein
VAKSNAQSTPNVTERFMTFHFRQRQAAPS